MTKLAKAIVQTYTNPTELYIHSNNIDGKEDGWKHIDTLAFHARRKLEREIGDLEFWIPRQADREANAQRWAKKYRNQYNGDEISTTNLQSSLASWKAEAFGLRVMQAELASFQKAYKEMTGNSFTTVKDQPDAEMPEDIAATLKEMDALDVARAERTNEAIPNEVLKRVKKAS